MIFKEYPSPVIDLKFWLAYSHNYSFIISYEPRSGKGYENYTGYTASWKNQNFDVTPHGKQPANRIDGGPWTTFKEAEEACKETLKQLLKKQ